MRLAKGPEAVCQYRQIAGLQQIEHMRAFPAPEIGQVIVSMMGCQFPGVEQPGLEKAILARGQADMPRHPVRGHIGGFDAGVLAQQPLGRPLEQAIHTRHGVVVAALPRAALGIAPEVVEPQRFAGRLVADQVVEDHQKRLNARIPPQNLPVGREHFPRGGVIEAIPQREGPAQVAQAQKIALQARLRGRPHRLELIEGFVIGVMTPGSGCLGKPPPEAGACHAGRHHHLGAGSDARQVGTIAGNQMQVDLPVVQRSGHQCRTHGLGAAGIVGMDALPLAVARGKPAHDPVIDIIEGIRLHQQNLELLRLQPDLLRNGRQRGLVIFPSGPDHLALPRDLHMGTGTPGCRIVPRTDEGDKIRPQRLDRLDNGLV